MPRYNPHKAYRTTPKRKYMAHTGHRCEDHPCCGHEDGYCPVPKAEVSSTPAGNGVPVLTENKEKDGYELKFPGKPTEAVLAMFRETKTLAAEARWHWHFKKKVWYAKRNEATREFAQLVISQSSGLGEVVPPQAAVEPIAPALPVEAASVAPKFAGGGDAIPLNVEHEQFSKAEWALEVQNGGTRLSYEDWVEAKLDLAAEEAVVDPAGPFIAELAREQGAPVEEVAALVPENVILASFTPPQVERAEATVTQSSPAPVADWRARFSWSDTQRRRERGQLPEQKRYLNGPKTEFLD